MTPISNEQIEEHAIKIHEEMINTVDWNSETFHTKECWLILAKEHLEQLAMLREENHKMREALTFYADPETYHALTFLFDPPAGGWIEDFSSDYVHVYYDRPMPGKLAREVLAPQPEKGE